MFPWLFPSQNTTSRHIPGTGLFRRDIWTIGLVRQPLEDIIRNGLTSAVQWYSAKPGSFLADPYGVVLPDGTRFILAERFDYRGAGDRRGKGEIVEACLAPGMSLDETSFQPVTNFPYHLSYPSLIFEDGDWYLFAESMEANGIACFTSPDPAGEWRFHNLFLTGIQAVDPTLVKVEGGWYLFCTRHDDRPLSRLYLFSGKTPFGPWTPHPDNPVKDDLGAARPAGPLFRGQDGRLYRPAQDCRRTYGGAVIIHRVDELTPQSFRETAIRSLSPLPGPWCKGLHTICPFGEDTLIDSKAWEWSLSEPFARSRRNREAARRFKVVLSEGSGI
jgi:hypothetical protein